MLERIRRHVLSNTVGYVGIFLVLGGTSYAAATGSIDSREIKNNTIRSTDIRNGQVLGRDVHDGAVQSRDVKNGSLLGADFKSGQLPHGPAGPSGVTTVTTRTRSGSGTGVTASCLSGEKVVGGGADGDLGPFTSYPVPGGGRPTGWFSKSEAAAPDGDDVTAYVVCARP